MDDKESKREAFLRLAEKRTNEILKRIRILSNCSNPYAYEYSELDIKKIFNAIDEELRIAKIKFTNNIKKSEFRLK